MTFIEKTKRFFEPCIYIPRHILWNIIQGSALSCYFIFSFEILRNIVTTLSDRDMNWFYHNIWIYSIVSIVLITSRFLFYKTGWNPIMHDGMNIYYKKYLNILVQADGNIVESIGTGRLISTLTKWVHEWLDALCDITDEWIWVLLTLVYAIFFVWRIDPTLGVVSIIVMILTVSVALISNNWMRKKRLKRQESIKECDHQAIVAIMSKNELLQSGGLSSILGKISSHLQDAKRYQYPVVLGLYIMEDFPRFLFIILRVWLYIYIAQSIMENTGSTFGDFAIFITVITFTEKVLSEFLRTIRQITRNFSAIEQLWSTFDSLTPIKWYSTGLPFSKKSKDIEINSISYGYNESKVFDKFSLTIKRGQKTALVGASGGGKTTLMKLIAGYLHPESGSISVLGNKLDETALKTYYPHIGYLTQDPGVFDATIRENLVSALTATWDQKNIEQKLIKALKLAHCDFVFELEHGLDTEIGERGVRLSWGQKQRLAIAKIFLKDPEIILLDEPTSALDSFSEEAITIALDELFKDRTVIIVAHRLQTVRKADDILVLEWGQVVERGTHTELVEKWGIYNRMLELQSGF